MHVHTGTMMWLIFSLRYTYKCNVWLSHISQSGASVNVLDLWQFTPLQEASSKGRSDVCSLLLSYGANPIIPNCHNKSALDLAPSDELRKKIECNKRQFTLQMICCLLCLQMNLEDTSCYWQLKKVISLV